MAERFFDTEGVTKSERVLHTPSSYARKHLCYMQEAGRLQSLRPHISRREGLESYLFLHVLSGSGSVTYGGQVYALGAGDMALLDCRERYEHVSSEEEPWELEWVHYDGAKAEAFYGLFQKKSPETPLFRAEGKDLPGIAALMQTEEMAEPQGELTADLLLTQLMLACLTAAGGKRDGANYERIREYLNEQAGAMTDERLEEMIAAQSGQDYAAADTGFTRRYGISIRGYLENRRLNTAKELLRFTIKPIDEIVTASGMQNETVFRELFLRYEEMSPEEYRKKWAQWVKG